MVIGLGVTAVMGTLVAVKFVREAGQAIAARNSPKQEWDM